MSEAIGIIGSACRFPGSCNSPSKFWELLRNPRDVLRDFPKERLNLGSFYHVNGEHHGSTNVEGKGYLLSEDPRLFDAAFFSINPLEADGMDPQQRLVLEAVYEALESAGCPLSKVQASKTAVFAGLMTGDYGDVQVRDLEALPNYNATGTARSFLSNRVSYCFDLQGPSMTVDTACSSSMVALHLAVNSLRNGESDMAIVAGANLIFDPMMYVAESTMHMLSPDSRSRMWDKDANGYARGEGVAVLILKSVKQAILDNDNIESVIKGTAVNSDGRTKGITMPSSSAQTDLIRKAYKDAGLDPVRDRCQFFEAHGTGTIAGDPVEARAIRDAFFPQDQIRSTGYGDSKLFVGSVKTVIGHLEGCAGLAGVLKASLALQHRTIPPNMHFHELNPSIEPMYEHLQVPTTATTWPEVVGDRLRASVNSFGFGGTNAHVVLEEYIPEKEPIHEYHAEQRFVGPLVFSAHTEVSLLENIERFATHIRENPSMDLRDLSWVLQTRRSELPFRTFFSGATRKELLGYMDAHVRDAMAAGTAGLKIGTTQTLQPTGTSRDKLGILGIFTGQGTQWPSMGCGLILQSPLFRQSIDRCEGYLASLPHHRPDWSLKAELMAEATTSRISEAALSQPLCTAIQVAMVDLLAASGVTLDAVVGHSSGEIAAAYAAGVISAESAIRISYYRGHYAKLACGPDGQRGGMLAVGMSLEQATDFCEQQEFQNRLCVAASNSATSVTLSGDIDAIEDAKVFFDSQKTFARQLQVDTAYHSHHMEPCAQRYSESLLACNIQVNPPREDCTWVSSVGGCVELYEDQDDLDLLKGQYWVDNLLRPVLFYEAIECALYAGGPFDVVAELGPHPALKGPTTQILKSCLGSALPYSSLMRRDTDEVEVFSGGLGYIWSYLGSLAVDLDGYNSAFDTEESSPARMLKGIPSYTWDHNRTYWKESRISRNLRIRDNQPHNLLGRRVPDDTDDRMRWRNILRLDEASWIRGHIFQGQIIVPGASYVSMAVEAAKMIADKRAINLIEILDVTIARPLIMREGHSTELITHIDLLADAVSPCGDQVLQAELMFYICQDDASSLPERTCVGKLAVHLGQPHVDHLPVRAQAPPNLVPVEVDKLYALLKELGLSYQGPFLGMKSSTRTNGFASASGSWSSDELEENFLIHPAILDVVFQSVFSAHSSPTSGGLWCPYLPVAMSRVLVNPNNCPSVEAGQLKVAMDAWITGSSATMLEADIQVPSSDLSHVSIQIEGLQLKSIVDANSIGDRLLYTETRWVQDVSTAEVAIAANAHKDTDEKLVEAIERTALYYFRDMLEKLSEDDENTFEWHHRLFLSAARHHLKAVHAGTHPVVAKRWLDDIKSDILALVDLYPDQIDLVLMQALGENLVPILRGQLPVLEVMMENDMLNRLYMEGCGFKILNEHIAHAMSQISHKFPQAKILEIGAGTGGTTRRVFDAIKNAYSTYVYTDISAAFFEKASEKFSDHKSRMQFRTLDIEKDVVGEGYEEGAYDVIIAANVLHATRKLRDTMQNVRSLLKPGGFLVLMEVTGDLLRIPFLMGALPGWWLGAETGDEGRQLGPGVSPIHWDDLLQDTGFSGVDTILHDMADAKKHSCSMIISQAIDDNVEILRNPVSFLSSIPRPDCLLILGGASLPVAKFVGDIKRSLPSWKRVITVSNNIEDLEVQTLPESTLVLSLTEVDKPLFASPMTASRLEALKGLFTRFREILWVTCGRLSKDPHSNMVVGLGRAIATEMPQLQLQFLDVESVTDLQSSVVLNALLRLRYMREVRPAEHNILWVNEPEAAVNDRGLVIPRLMQVEDINQRYNSSRRTILKQATTNEMDVEIVSSGASLSLTGVDPTRGSGIEKYIGIRVSHSASLPCDEHGENNQLYLCVGTIFEDGRTALALSKHNCSSVYVSTNDVYVVEDILVDAGVILPAIVDQLVAKILLFNITPRGTILVYEAGEKFASAISRNVEERSQAIRFATSKSGNCPNDWIFMHPFALDRAVAQSMPPDLSCVIDLSTKQNRSIGSCIPQSCEILTFNSKLVDRHISSGSLRQSLAISYEKAVSSAHERDHSQKIVVTHISALTGAPAETTSYPHVVDWNNAGRLQLTVQPRDTSSLFSPSKTYLMVGLTGELGQSICRWMVSSGARHLAITSRRGEVNSSWLDLMHQQGAVVQVFCMDVSNRDETMSVCKRIKETMPPIAGVCNAAMVLSDKLFAQMDVASLNEALKPKVDGSKNLDEIFHDDKLDFFIFFSSIASVVGNGGQSNYHAANLFMQSLAANRRTRGVAASVINIGLVVDAGYVVRAGRRIEDHLRNQFYIPLSESDVHHLFAEAVFASPTTYSGPSDIIMGIEPFEDHDQATTRPPWYSNPRFSQLWRQKQVNVSQEEQRSLGSDVSTKKKLEAADDIEDAFGVIQEAFSSKLESMLQLTTGSTNVNVPLLDLGCDSLLAVEIRTWFLREISVEVPVLKLLSGESISQICEDATSQYMTKRSDDAQKPSSTLGPGNALEDLTSDSVQEQVVIEEDPSPHLSPVAFDNTSSDSSSKSESEGDSTGSDTTPAISDTAEDLYDSIENNSVILGKGSQMAGGGDSTKRVATMSHAQSRIWFLTDYLDDPRAYNIAVSYKIHGPLNVARFQRALATIVDRHASLQTRFFADEVTGEPMQGVMSSSAATFSHIETTDETLADQTFCRLKEIVWNLDRGRTFKAVLISRISEPHTIIFAYHHIMMDGISWVIFLQDLKAAYEMKRILDVDREYIDYSEDQRSVGKLGGFGEQLEYWKNQHSPLPDVLPLLPMASVRTRRPLRVYQTHTTSKEIGVDLVTRIKQSSRTLQITPFHFHLCVIQILLAKLTDVQDLCIGVVSANRSQSDIARTIGLFINLLPSRFRVEQSSSFAELAKATASKANEGSQNSAVPFDKILEELKVPRQTSHAPLFQATLNYRVGAMSELELGSCRMNLDKVADAENPYDLGFGILESSAGSSILQVVCQDYLYDTQTGELLVGAYIHLLEQLTLNHSIRVQDCRLYHPDKAQASISLGLGPIVNYDWPDSLSTRFDDVVVANPTELAVSDQDRTITYSQLANEINHVAAKIDDLDLPQGSLIGVLCRPSAVLIASMLAILQTGHVYVPLDLSLPQVRHASIMSTCEPRAIICQHETLSHAAEIASSGVDVLNASDILISAQNSTSPRTSRNRLRPDSPSFLFFTSGSTGIPKGIWLSQYNISNHMVMKSERLSLGKECVLQQSSFAFDMSLTQIFCALANGGRLVIVSQESRGDPIAISEMMQRHRITFTIATPSEYSMMLKYGQAQLEACESWRIACMGGETVKDNLIKSFERLPIDQLSLVNCYGPTETSLAVTFEDIPLYRTGHRPDIDYIPIGKALPNYSIHIVDEHGEAVPAGFVGEICVGGAGVGLGYFKMPELTSSKFVENPFASSQALGKGWKKMFKTGDRGRMLSDGSIIFFGRSDHDTMIKMRGLRIDLEDVASTLLQSSSGAILEAIVTVRGDPQYLVAHVIFQEGREMTNLELQKLSKSLPIPQYMCPARIIPLSRLPVTPNGKIDRKAIENMSLPAPTSAESRRSNTLTLMEGEISLLWSRTLQQTFTRETLARDTDFFEVGGNSMLLVVLQGYIKENFGMTIAIRDLYQASTLERMAARINATKEQSRRDEYIDWEFETTPAILVNSEMESSVSSTKTTAREVLMTGSEGFLGSEILLALIQDISVSKIHCVAVSGTGQALPASEKIVIYHGSLRHPSLGLTTQEIELLKNSVDFIIHAGSIGHCLNNYSSLRTPNVQSTRFLAELAHHRSVPLHLISSSRVILLSGHAELAPTSVAAYHPATDGSEGFTASKWASERLLEKASEAHGLTVCIHRPCAIVGDQAPSEDALNALLRYSALMRTVPEFKTFDGYFDFCEVEQVVSQIVAEVTGPVEAGLVRYVHHSGKVKMPVQQLRERMQEIHACAFSTDSMQKWTDRARGLGMDEVIATYLEALTNTQGRLTFPYLGKGLD